MTSKPFVPIGVVTCNVPVLIYSTLIETSLAGIPYVEPICFFMEVIVATEIPFVTGPVLSIFETDSQYYQNNFVNEKLFSDFICHAYVCVSLV